MERLEQHAAALGVGGVLVTRPRCCGGLTRRLRTVVCVGGAVLAGCGGALALSAAQASPLTGDLTAAPANGIATAVPGSIAAAFSFLGAPATGQESLPQDAVLALEANGSVAAHYGINPSLARLAGSVDGANVWLVPGSAGSCIWVEVTAATCGPNDLVSEQGVELLAVPVSGAPSYAIGVLPDGAALAATNADGTPAAISRSGDAFYVAGEQSTTQLTIRTTDGASVGAGDLSSQPSPPSG
jgi:hypothetical protein